MLRRFHCEIGSACGRCSNTLVLFSLRYGTILDIYMLYSAHTIYMADGSLGSLKSSFSFSVCSVIEPLGEPYWLQLELN